MMEIGRLCVKVAGRDAGNKCVIVDILENKLVLIDGDVRRRKCSVTHLIPTTETIDVKQGATHEDVVSAFDAKGLKSRTTKPKTAKPKPVKTRKSDKTATKVAKKSTKKKQ